jgi:hypothetical protein
MAHLPGLIEHEDMINKISEFTKGLQARKECWTRIINNADLF